MRLTVLLDSIAEGDRAPRRQERQRGVNAIGAEGVGVNRAGVNGAGADGAGTTSTDARNVLGRAGAAVRGETDDTEFDRIMSGLLPCRVQDPELWFAEQPAGIAQAKELCRQCPLMAQCLAGALDRGEPWGVWGGQVLVNGQVVAVKRGRGRPRKVDVHPGE